MSDPKDVDPTMEENYNEDEDSDFDENAPSSLSDESDDDSKIQDRSRQLRKPTKKHQPEDELGELDSGDEATILERKKNKRKKKRKGEENDESEREDQGWKAKTRAMRQREQSELNQRKLASTKGSMLDIDKIFQEMQTSGDACDRAYLQRLHSTKESTATTGTKTPTQNESGKADKQPESQKLDTLDSIRIRKTYRFAGEVHIEEKTVPRSSEEAQAWLAENSGRSGPTAASGVPLTKSGLPLRRPLRKISRFDPNLNNPDSFKKNWEKTLTEVNGPAGPKINTVEKSRLDWVDHVSKAGLRDELSEHAKAKGSYMSQKDFLDRVEHNHEEEARRVRVKI